METVWCEHDRGADEAVYDRWRQGQEYLAEDAESYRRPIVAREYEAPVDIFDAHLYQKAGRVLNWLRQWLGPAVFWAGVRQYLERHRGGLVETADFRRALEDASGRDLGQAFDDWIYHGGHPALKLAYSYSAADGTVELTLSQTQAVDDVTPCFTLDVPVVVHTAAGERRVVVPLDAKQRTVNVRVDGAPAMVRVDPGDTILKTLELDLPVGLLTAQLTDDPDPIGRIRAAQALAKPAKTGGLAAVIAALTNDRFWGVRAECAAALAAARTDAARDALVAAAARETHPKARRAIARALGRIREPSAVAPLRALLAGDPSYYVRGEAAEALGATRQPGVLPDLERALAEDAHADAIRAGALRGLGATRDPEALPLLRRWARGAGSEQARAAAASGLGTLARHVDDPLQAEIRDELTELTRDRSLRVRMVVVRALGALPGPASAAALRAVRDGDGEARVRREAAEQLRGRAGTAAARVREIEDAFEELRAEHRRLAGRVQALETLLGRGKSGT
jgi:aminopeptidase N